MSSKHEPAFPGIELNGNGSPYASFFGMTKREFFALEILKGLVSNSRILDFNSGDYCRTAIAFADELITKLEK